MQRNTYYFLFLFIIVFISCWQDSTFKGYTCTSTGLYYKLITIGEGKIKPHPGDYLQLRITYKTIKDSVFSDTYSNNETGKVILPFNHSSFSGSFEEGLQKMNEGDSASFIVNADSLFNKYFNAPLPVFLENERMIKMDVKLFNIMSQQQYTDELQHFREMMEDRDIEEQRKLQSFLDSVPSKFFPLENGMYYLPLKAGVGEPPESGNTVKINYTGTFLNGKKFESTYDRGEPLEFTYGEQGQIIAGLKTALSLMNEGAKAKFIIPSRLAFGEEGSSTGIVPPFTTVIYEVELLTLTKYNN